MPLHTFFIDHRVQILIVFAGIALYISSKAVADAMVGARPNLPGRLAIGQWLPIAICALTAVILHRPTIAIGIVFSTSVACLSLAIGAVVFLGVSIIPASARRSWAMLVPVALLTFFAGFRASVSPFNAIVLAIQGLCVLLLWIDKPDPKQVAPTEPPAGRGVAFRSAQLIIALALAAVGSWFGVHGVVESSEKSAVISTGLLTTTLLGPLLVLPIIGTGTELAQRSQAVTAITSQVGVALLNLCALLPLVVFANAILQFADALIAAIKAGDSAILRLWRTLSSVTITPFPFPLAVWRVDTVVLIALGLLLLPIAIGKWSLSKSHGIGLMIGYAIYLGLAIVIGVMRI